MEGWIRRRARGGEGAGPPGALARVLQLTMVVVALGLLAAPVAGAKKVIPGSTPGVHYAKGDPVCPQKINKKHRTCFALKRVVVSKSTPGARPYTVHATPTPGPAGGLTPAELASAYGYSTAGGTGQTVAIVDAFNDPKIEADLGTYSTQYGLPSCTKANGCLKVVSQTGSTTSLPTNDTSGWATEETLDVEAVHAVCPNCKILLVETNDNSNANLDAGVNRAATMGAQEISNSYGGPEGASVSATDKAAYDHPGKVITVSTGDDGWYGWDYINSGGSANQVPDLPSTLNSVVAVGGTALNLTQTGTRASEAVWNDNGPQDIYGYNLGLRGATGGGCSTLNGAHAWQYNVAGYNATTCGTKRLAADVAAVGDPLTGFDIYTSYNCGGACGTGWQTIGGTSLASPVVAAMWGLAGGAQGMKYPSLTLYGHFGDATPSLYDVTVGGNGYCDGLSVGQCGTSNPNAFGYGLLDCDYTSTASPGTPAAGLGQCDAAPGYDGPSGVGTPVGLNLFKPTKFAVITKPASTPVNVSEPYSASHSVDPYRGAHITSYTWNWGDGTANSTGVNVTHKYTHTGTFKITLTVTDSYGAKSVATTHVTVS